MLKRTLLTLLALCLLCGACAALAEDAIVAAPAEDAVPEADEVWLEAPCDATPAPQVAAAAKKVKRSPELIGVGISNPVEYEYSWIYPYPLVMQKEAVCFTVYTNTDARYLSLLNKSGKRLKKWSAAKAAKTVKVNGVKQRKWTVKYTLSSAGLKTLYFGVAYGASSKPTGKVALTFEVLQKPVIKSVSCTPANPDVGEEISYTFQTNENAQHLTILDSKGNPIDAYGPYITDQGNGTRVVNGRFTLNEGGSQKVTFKVGFTKDRGVTQKAVTIDVKDSSVKSAHFYRDSIYAGDAVQAQVVTGTQAQALAMFNEKNELIMDWEADQCSRILDGQRVWTVETTLRRIGSRTLSFRSRSTPLDPYMGDDAKQFGPGTNAPITVIGKNIVDVSSTDCAMIKLNDSGWYDYQYYWDGHRLRNDWYLASVDLLLISFGAPDNARYVHVYNENGEQVVRLGLDGNTRSYVEHEHEKQWYVPVYLMKGSAAWGETFTVRASVDGTNVGAGQSFSIKGIDPVPIAPGQPAEMYVSGINYPEESYSAVSFTAAESRTYRIQIKVSEGRVHYLLYRAGSNEILKDDEAARSEDEYTQYIDVQAQAGVTYVLRLDLLNCYGVMGTISIS